MLFIVLIYFDLLYLFALFFVFFLCFFSISKKGGGRRGGNGEGRRRAGVYLTGKVGLSSTLCLSKSNKVPANAELRFAVKNEGKKFT